MTIKITIIGEPADVERAVGLELTYLRDHPSRSYKLNGLDYDLALLRTSPTTAEVVLLEVTL